MDFKPGDVVDLKLAQSWLRSVNGRRCVVAEVLDPDNDLYKVTIDDDGSFIEVTGDEMVLVTRGLAQ